MTIKTLGMGIVKFLKAKAPRKTLTTTPKYKGELRIKEINKKLKKTPPHAQQDMAEDYAQEVADIYADKWKVKE